MKEILERRALRPTQPLVPQPQAGLPQRQPEQNASNYGARPRVVLKQPKYYDLEHEKVCRFEEERRRIALKLKIEDFSEFMPFDLKEHKDIHI